MAKVMKDERTSAPAVGAGLPVDAPAPAEAEAIDPAWPLDRLFRDLRSSAQGLSTREAERRLLVNGPESAQPVGRAALAGELRRAVHPSARRSCSWPPRSWPFVSGTAALAVAIVAVILLNAGSPSRRSGRPSGRSEALAAFLPERATVLRDGSRAADRGRRSWCRATC